jgi:hypothetical protein
VVVVVAALLFLLHMVGRKRGWLSPLLAVLGIVISIFEFPVVVVAIAAAVVVTRSYLSFSTTSTSSCPTH